MYRTLIVILVLFLFGPSLFGEVDHGPARARPLILPVERAAAAERKSHSEGDPVTAVCRPINERAGGCYTGTFTPLLESRQRHLEDVEQKLKGGFSPPALKQAQTNAQQEGERIAGELFRLNAECGHDLFRQEPGAEKGIDALNPDLREFLNAKHESEPGLAHFLKQFTEYSQMLDLYCRKSDRLTEPLKQELLYLMYATLDNLTFQSRIDSEGRFAVYRPGFDEESRFRPLNSVSQTKSRVDLAYRQLAGGESMSKADTAIALDKLTRLQKLRAMQRHFNDSTKDFLNAGEALYTTGTYGVGNSVGNWLFGADRDERKVFDLTHDRMLKLARNLSEFGKDNPEIPFAKAAGAEAASFAASLNQFAGQRSEATFAEVKKSLVSRGVAGAATVATMGLGSLLRGAAGAATAVAGAQTGNRLAQAAAASSGIGATTGVGLHLVDTALVRTIDGDEARVTAGSLVKSAATGATFGAAAKFLPPKIVKGAGLALGFNSANQAAYQAMSGKYGSAVSEALTTVVLPLAMHSAMAAGSKPRLARASPPKPTPLSDEVRNLEKVHAEYLKDNKTSPLFKTVNQVRDALGDAYKKLNLNDPYLATKYMEFVLANYRLPSRDLPLQGISYKVAETVRRLNDIVQDEYEIMRLADHAGLARPKRTAMKRVWREQETEIRGAFYAGQPLPPTEKGDSALLPLMISQGEKAPLIAMRGLRKLAGNPEYITDEIKDLIANSKVGNQLSAALVMETLKKPHFGTDPSGQKPHVTFLCVIGEMCSGLMEQEFLDYLKASGRGNVSTKHGGSMVAKDYAYVAPTKQQVASELSGGADLVLIVNNKGDDTVRLYREVAKDLARPAPERLKALGIKAESDHTSYANDVLNQRLAKEGFTPSRFEYFFDVGPANYRGHDRMAVAADLLLFQRLNADATNGVQQLGRYLQIGKDAPEAAEAAAKMVRSISGAKKAKLEELADRFLAEGAETNPGQLANLDHVRSQHLLALERDAKALQQAFGIDAGDLRLLMKLHDLGKVRMPGELVVAFQNAGADFLTANILGHEYASMHFIEKLGGIAKISAGETKALSTLIANHNYGPDLSLPKNHSLKGDWWPSNFGNRMPPVLSKMGLNPKDYFSADGGSVHYNSAPRTPLALLLSAYDRATMTELTKNGVLAWEKYILQDWGNGSKIPFSGKAIAERMVGEPEKVRRQVDALWDELTPRARTPGFQRENFSPYRKMADGTFDFEKVLARTREVNQNAAEGEALYRANDGTLWRVRKDGDAWQREIQRVGGGWETDATGGNPVNLLFTVIKGDQAAR